MRDKVAKVFDIVNALLRGTIEPQGRRTRPPLSSRCPPQPPPRSLHADDMVKAAKKSPPTPPATPPAPKSPVSAQPTWERLPSEPSSGRTHSSVVRPPRRLT
jgi:hypothetical protein